ncbi:MAG: M23 family metallopeptidase, partial [Muribaculaceae bacterium]|nr:M23 family metallopeptidase [Muribaculaceae bacterium]
MIIDKRVALAAFIAVSVSAAYTQSQDKISKVKVMEAVGEIRSASTSAVDSLRAGNKTDSLLSDYLSDLSIIIHSELNNGAEADVFSIFDFIGNAYDESGFYETGSWEGDSLKRSLKIYEGPLPKIDESKVCRPVKGRVTSSFGYRTDPNKIHYGIDLAGKIGDTVSVAIPGVVLKCGYDKKGYGWYVCVKDSLGIETRYAHLSKVLV